MEVLRWIREIEMQFLLNYIFNAPWNSSMHILIFFGIKPWMSVTKTC